MKPNLNPAATVATAATSDSERPVSSELKTRISASGSSLAETKSTNDTENTSYSYSYSKSSSYGESEIRSEAEADTVFDKMVQSWEQGKEAANSNLGGGLSRSEGSNGTGNAASTADRFWKQGVGRAGSLCPTVVELFDADGDIFAVPTTGVIDRHNEEDATKPVEYLNNEAVVCSSHGDAMKSLTLRKFRLEVGRLPPGQVVIKIEVGRRNKI